MSPMPKQATAKPLGQRPHPLGPPWPTESDVRPRSSIPERCRARGKIVIPGSRRLRIPNTYTPSMPPAQPSTCTQQLPNWSAPTSATQVCWPQICCRRSPAPLTNYEQREDEKIGKQHITKGRSVQQYLATPLRYACLQSIFTPQPRLQIRQRR